MGALYPPLESMGDLGSRRGAFAEPFLEGEPSPQDDFCHGRRGRSHSYATALLLLGLGCVALLSWMPYIRGKGRLRWPVDLPAMPMANRGRSLPTAAGRLPFTSRGARALQAARNFHTASSPADAEPSPEEEKQFIDSVLSEAGIDPDNEEALKAAMEDFGDGDDFDDFDNDDARGYDDEDKLDEPENVDDLLDNTEEREAFRRAKAHFEKGDKKTAAAPVEDMPVVEDEEEFNQPEHNGPRGNWEYDENDPDALWGPYQGEPKRPYVDFGTPLSKYVTTNAGVQMPRLFFALEMTVSIASARDNIQAFTRSAIRAGIMGIDCAMGETGWMNHLERQYEYDVGTALGEMFKSGEVTRESVFIQSKIKPDYKRTDVDMARQVNQSITRSLANLRMPYIDCLLLVPRWPLPDHDETMEAWRAMESAVRAGFVRQIGLCLPNTVSLWEAVQLYTASTIKPAVLQQSFGAETGFETWNRRLRAWCAERDIYLQQMWPRLSIVRPTRTGRYEKMAEKYNVCVEALFWRFLMALGVTPMTWYWKANDTEMLRLESVAHTIPLTEEEGVYMDMCLDSSYDDKGEKHASGLPRKGRPLPPRPGEIWPDDNFTGSREINITHLLLDLPGGPLYQETTLKPRKPVIDLDAPLTLD